MNLTFHSKFGLPPLVCHLADYCVGGATVYVPDLPPHYGEDGHGGGGNNNNNGNGTATTSTSNNNNQQQPIILTNTNPDLLTQLRSLIMANQEISLGFALVLGYLVLKR